MVTMRTHTPLLPYNLKVFQTVTCWNPDFEAIGKLVVGKSGPDFLAKDQESVQQIIEIMEYHVVDIQLKVGEVDASDIVGTRLLPRIIDPNQN